MGRPACPMSARLSRQPGHSYLGRTPDISTWLQRRFGGSQKYQSEERARLCLPARSRCHERWQGRFIAVGSLGVRIWPVRSVRRALTEAARGSGDAWFRAGVPDETPERGIPYMIGRQ